MIFREQVLAYLKKHGIKVEKFEQNGDVESIVCHIPVEQNAKFDAIQKQMEIDLPVITLHGQIEQFNTIIVESDKLEE